MQKTVKTPKSSRTETICTKPMTPYGTEFTIKLAETADELYAAQRLRYRVFVQELGGSTDSASADKGLERDEYDTYFDHLILQDKALPKGDDVIGVYRLLRSDMAVHGARFYTANEFCLDKIRNCGRNTVELGRSCVDKRYRNGAAMHLLWQGLADYVSVHGIEILFGVASFHGTDPAAVSHALSYLHHNYRAPDELRVSAHGANAIAMDILSEKETDHTTALKQIPPLIKAYMRLGGKLGDGAFVDYGFNTIDVCLVMDTVRMAQKYKAVYQRESAA